MDDMKYATKAIMANKIIKKFDIRYFTAVEFMILYYFPYYFAIF